MPDTIAELLVTEVAIDKLGARGITTTMRARSLATLTLSCATRTRHLPADVDCSSAAPTAAGR
jgi:hypothetical protein